MPNETAAARYARDYGNIPAAGADRKDRELDNQGGVSTAEERTNRLYVNDVGGATAVNKTN